MSSQSRNRRQLIRPFAYGAWLVLALPQSASANAGLPMIFLTLPRMVVALLPVILVEAYLCRRHIQIPFRTMLGAMTKMNLASTFLGIPVTWFVLVVLQITVSVAGGGIDLRKPPEGIMAVTWQAPWLAPYESEMGWMIPVATLVLLVPFFFASWYTEYLVAKRLLPDTDRRVLSRALRNANFVSYSLLALWVILGMG